MGALRLPNQKTIACDRPVIMGILNVTPDSFSDGGLYTDVDTAVDYAKQMWADGADIIDVGGESTRPGSQRVGAAEQIRRVVPIIQRLLQQIDGVAISVDTTLGVVAEAAVNAGAAILNDVSAGRDSPEMFRLSAGFGTPLVLTHMLGSPATMQQNPSYVDVVAEVTGFLVDRAGVAMAAGVPQEQIIIDPGVGFGKSTQHNLALLAHLDGLVSTGFPVLLGTSRKRFLGEICQVGLRDTVALQKRVGATCATTALGVAKGVRLFRVHDVHANRQAADTAWAIRQAGSGS